MALFDEDWGINNDPIEDVDITTTILYFSKEELKEFKELAKAGIKIEFGQEYQQKGNLSDFLLLILRERYGANQSKPAGIPVQQPQLIETNNILPPELDPNVAF